MANVFFDSDQNHNGFNSGFDGETYLNHPGWLKDLFQPKKAEREREDEYRASLKSTCPHNSEMNCADLDDAYDCISDRYDDYMAGGTGGRGSRRVRNRGMKVTNEAMKKVGQWMDTRDCEGGTSAIDVAQGETAQTIAELEELQEKSQQDIENAYAEAQSLLNQQATMYAQDKTKMADQSKMMMYAGGGLILLLTLGIIFKK